jgi:RNA polymerase sigma-70 factor (ECF subfamily)
MLFSKHNNSEEPDEILLKRLRDSQDNRAAAALFQRYAAHVLGVCQYYLNHQQDALDAVMDVFALAIENIPKTEIKDFKNWLFIISKNHCLQQLKKNGRYRHLFVEITENTDGGDVQNDVMSSLYRGEGEDEIELLTSLLTKLDDRQETCLTLFYFEEKTYQEIAVITNFDVGLVRSYIQNGRRNLRRLLTNALKNSANDKF